MRNGSQSRDKGGGPGALAACPVASPRSKKRRVSVKPPVSAVLRRRAENRALTQAALMPEALRYLPPADVQHILHELQVHQIELEMQNEELRQAREQLEASRARYFDLYDLAPVGYFTLDEDGVILEANLAAAALLGVPRNQLVLQPMARFIVPEDQDVYYRHRKKVFEPAAPEVLRPGAGQAAQPGGFDSAPYGAVQVCELRMMRAGAAPFWAQMEAVAARDAQGSAVCRTVMSDIPESRRAAEALRESEARYRRITASLSDYHYSVRVENGRAVETVQSPACVAVTGYTAEEFADSPFLWIGMVAPEDREQVKERAQQILAGNDIPPIEHRIIRKDGEVRWVCDTIILHKDAGGKLLSYDGVIKDITEHRRAEGELRQRQQEIYRMERVRTLGELAASLAHEINQPLAGILSNAQAAQRLLAGAEPDPNEIRDILADIVADDKRAGEVIHRLRALLQAREPARVSMGVNEAVRDVVGIVSSDIAIRNVVLLTELAEGLPPACADKIQIEQVVLNLILNAVQAMAGQAAEGQKIVVATERAASGGTLVSVRDAGPGIPGDSVDEVFKPFFTTKSDGLGMGLPISRSIVTAHGGRIWGENHPAGGARFSFWLPEAESPQKP